MESAVKQKIVDPATEIKKAYLVRAKDAAWPMTSARLDSIYDTEKRALRLSSSAAKQRERARALKARAKALGIYNAVDEEAEKAAQEKFEAWQAEQGQILDLRIREKTTHKKQYGSDAAKKSEERDREPLIWQLLEIAHDWDRQCRVVLQDQAGFDAWFFSQIGLICRVPFAWKQAPKKGVPDVKHQHLSFGAAQKFLNLVLKDWWARSEQAVELGALCGHLHAPLDDIVVTFIKRARPALLVPVISRLRIG
jgi:hypothetical protein